MSRQPQYVPQAGTIPAKVIAHFKTLPPSTELSTAMVIEAIGQPAGWTGLVPCLKTAVDHGVMSKRSDRNGWVWWRLVDPDHVIRAKPADEGQQTVEGVDIGRVHTKPAPLEDHTAIDDTEPGNRPESIQKQGRRPEPGPATEAGDFECALTNAGRLLINTGTDRVALSPEHTQQLMAYLDEQRGIEWEAA